MPTTVTRTVQPAGGDYTTLSAFEAGEQADITLATGNDTIVEADCATFDDATQVTFAGWTTSATNFIRVFARDDHGGIFGGTSYRLTGTFAGSFCIEVANGGTRMDIRFEGIQTRNDSGSGTRQDFRLSGSGGGGGIRLDRVVSLSQGHGILIQGTSGGPFVRLLRCDITAQIAAIDTTGSQGCRGQNCLFFGFATGSVGSDPCVQAAFATGGTLFKNCYAVSRVNSGANLAWGAFTGSVTLVTCASHDTTGSVGLQNIAISTSEVISISPFTGQDHHLVGTSSLIDGGTDTSGDAAPFDFIRDMDGNLFGSGTGTPGAWDIGFHEFGGVPALSAFIRADNFLLSSGEWNTQLFASSIVARSIDTASTGYVRQVIKPKDDSSSTPAFDTRNGGVRNYYTLPPSAFFNWYKVRADLSAGDFFRREDGVRYYMRIYKHLQRVVMDGPTLIRGTLKAPAYVHPLSPQADEEFRYSNAIPNLNNFVAEFWFMPTFSFADQADDDFEFARFERDSSNYIRLLALAEERYQREYNIDDVYGPGIPKFRLQKVRAGSVTAEVDIAGVYYGYSPGEASVEATDDPMRITVAHQEGGALLIKVWRSGHVGKNFTFDDQVAFALTGESDIVYNGHGWYGEPAIFQRFPDAEDQPVNRKIFAGRADIVRRTQTIETKEASLAGEKDPYRGQIVRNNPYIETEDFDRANDSNLGTDWTVIRQTGNGFNIISNKAQCAEAGFEYWSSRRVSHADFIIQASLGIFIDGDLVGVLGRIELDGVSTRDQVFGYGAELIQTGASSADLRIVRWYDDSRTILATQALSAYTSGTEVVMQFRPQGPDIEAEVLTLDLSTSLATAQVTDDIFRKPGRLGIYGETGGAGQLVTVDDWSVSPNFVLELS